MWTFNHAPISFLLSYAIAPTFLTSFSLSFSLSFLIFHHRCTLYPQLLFLLIYLQFIPTPFPWRHTAFVGLTNHSHAIAFCLEIVPTLLIFIYFLIFPYLYLSAWNVKSCPLRELPLSGPLLVFHQTSVNMVCAQLPRLYSCRQCL